MSSQQKAQVILLRLYAEQTPTAFIRMGDNTNDKDQAIARSMITQAWNESVEEVEGLESIRELGQRTIENNLKDTIERLTKEVTAFIQSGSNDGSFEWFIYDNHETNRCTAMLTRVPVGN